MRKRNAERKKTRCKFGIVPKFLIGILIPLFAVLWAMGIFLGVEVSKTVNQSVSTELGGQSTAASSQVSAFFERYFGMTEGLAATQIVRDIANDKTNDSMQDNRLFASLMETLNMLQQDNAEDVDYIWIASLTTGEVAQSDGKLYSPSEIDITTRAWYQQVKKKNDSIVSSMYTSINTNSTMITVASPVYNNGWIVAIVGMDLKMDTLNQMLSKVKIGQTGYITLYDSASQIVYHPDSTLIETNVKDINYSQNMLDVILNKQDSDAIKYTRDGTAYYGSTVNISKLGFTMLGVMPEAEFTAQTTAIMRILVIGVICCGILMALICVFLALSITKPLKRLNASVSMLADGALDVKVDIKGNDEVSAVGRNIRRIIDRLSEYILYIDEISYVLGQIGQGNLQFCLKYAYAGEFAKVKEALLGVQDTLTKTVMSIAQSSSQVNAGAEQIAIGAQSLAQGATEQASSVQALASSVQDLSAQTTEEANKAVEAGKFLQKIEAEVDKSNHQMVLMRTAMDDISMQSNTIRSIIKTIDDIAFQTNILALNAAVEAARAGAAGKGFAVVADEVRNLAGKSADAGGKTNEQIENSVQAVKHGEELTQVTAQALEAVSDETKKIVETIDTVASSYHDQADKLSEIARGIDQIAGVVQTNSATAEQSAAASEELSGQARAMKDQVAHFKLNIEL